MVVYKGKKCWLLADGSFVRIVLDSSLGHINIEQGRCRSFWRMGAQLKNFLGAALLSHKESWVVDVMSKIFQEIGYLGIRGTHTAASLI